MKQELQDRLAALSPAQRALVELRLKKKSVGENADSIPRRKQQDHCEQADLQFGSQVLAVEGGKQIGPDEDRQQQAVPAARTWRSGTAAAPPPG